MVKQLTIVYNKRDNKISLYEGEEGEEKKEIVILESELYKFIYELNLESFIYFQHYDFAYSLYCLKKAEALLNTYKISAEGKNIVDEQILVLNNMAFVYSKMGLTDDAYKYCQKILDLLKEEKDKKKNEIKLKMNRPDYFESKTEKIKFKKIKARTCLSMCILLSETFKHVDAVKQAEIALKNIISLFYDSILLSYHLLLKNQKSEMQKKDKNGSKICGSAVTKNKSNVLEPSSKKV